MNGVCHFFTITLDQRLQFFDFLGCDLSLDITIDAINDRQHPDNKIDFTHHNLAMVTQLDGEQYQESNQSMSIETVNIRNICRTGAGARPDTGIAGLTAAIIAGQC